MTTPPKKYSDEEELRELSLQYITDARQFLEQAGILLDHPALYRSCQRHLGYLNKISVMIYMSIECSLKSMISASHLGEEPSSVYWERIRPGGHSISKLMKEIDDFAAKIGDSNLEAKLDNLAKVDVSERYALEVSVASELLGDFNIGESDLDEQIKLCRELLETAKLLEKKVWDIRKNDFAGQRVLPPSDVKAVLKRIKTKPPK